MKKKTSEFVLVPHNYRRLKQMGLGSSQEGDTWKENSCGPENESEAICTWADGEVAHEVRTTGPQEYSVGASRAGTVPLLL